MSEAMAIPFKYERFRRNEQLGQGSANCRVCEAPAIGSLRKERKLDCFRYLY